MAQTWGERGVIVRPHSIGRGRPPRVRNARRYPPATLRAGEEAMTMSRWKVMAGVLGVSLGGLAAIAGQCPRPDRASARRADEPPTVESPKVPRSGSNPASKALPPTPPIDVPPPPLPDGTTPLALPLPAATTTPAPSPQAAPMPPSPATVSTGFAVPLSPTPTAGKKAESPKPEMGFSSGVVPVGALLPPVPATETKAPPPLAGLTPPAPSTTQPLPTGPSAGAPPIVPSGNILPIPGTGPAGHSPTPTPSEPKVLTPVVATAPASPPASVGALTPAATPTATAVPPYVDQPLAEPVRPPVKLGLPEPDTTTTLVKPVSTAPVTTMAAATKFKIILRVGEGEPLFEVRHGDDLVMKVLCEKVDIKSPEKGQGLSAVTATGKVRFVGFGAEGTCDSFSFLAGTGEVVMAGNVKVQVKDKLGRVESELTTDKMQYRLDTTAMPGTLKP